MGGRQWCCAFGVFAAVLAAGCDREAEPVAAAKAFAAAMLERDATELLRLVDDASRAELEQSAERATDQIGGRRRVGAYEMLQVVDVDPRFQVVKAEQLARSETEATVRLDGVDGSSYVVPLVLEDAKWHVRLDLLRRLQNP